MLNPYEQVLVSGRGGVGSTGYFNGSIYNGTECTVTKILYRVTTRRGRDTTERIFANTEYIPALQTTDVIFHVDVYDNDRHFVRWGIDSVEASCPRRKPGS